MSRPSAGRALGVAVLCAFALGASAASALAEDPILGFTDAHSQQQRAYESRYQDGVNPKTIGNTSRALSRKPQFVGTNGSRQSFEYSVQRLRSYGLDVSTRTYGVYSSRPLDVSVTMTKPYTRQLATKEHGFPWQQNFGDVVEGYNAFSPSGDVTGDVVYANYGLPEDYAALDKLGISVAGKIVLVRYGGSFRGVKAQQAEIRGAKGVLIYSDPADDGFTKGPVYPDGPWRPADAIQRGSIQYIFNYPGDPLTPGKPAVPGTKRLSPDDATDLPRIPTTPISYGEAQPLLEGLSGPRGARVASRAALPITYHVGPGGTQVHLKLDIAYDQTPVRDMLVTVRGTSRPDEKVVLGAHYDAWTYGTSDDTSGWTTMMEVARNLGKLLDRGWRPDRTIVIAGWDGEEYGLFGSTEYAEQERARPACATPSPTPTSTAPAAPSSARPECRSSTTRSCRRRSRCPTRAPARRCTTRGRATKRRRRSGGSGAARITRRSSTTSACRRSRPASRARQRRDVPLGLRRHVQHGALPRPRLPRSCRVGEVQRRAGAAARQRRRAPVPLLRLRGSGEVVRGRPASRCRRRRRAPRRSTSARCTDAARRLGRGVDALWRRMPASCWPPADTDSRPRAGRSRASTPP